MPRRGEVKKRSVPPDLKYGNELVSKFTNRVMENGKKSVAQKIVYRALDIIQEKREGDPLEVFQRAVKNATPLIRVKARRVGGATYQIPTEVRADQGLSLAMKWLITFARARKGRSMAEKLASEILDASDGQGVSIKRKDDLHRMAEANRAFAHYRW
jgi:small subunit ribosomal protein S7